MDLGAVADGGVTTTRVDLSPLPNSPGLYGVPVFFGKAAGSFFLPQQPHKTKNMHSNTYLFKKNISISPPCLLDKILYFRAVILQVLRSKFSLLPEFFIGNVPYKTKIAEFLCW